MHTPVDSVVIAPGDGCKAMAARLSLKGMQVNPYHQILEHVEAIHKRHGNDLDGQPISGTICPHNFI